MPANLYPYAVGDPVLRTCRRCRSRVAQPAMCVTHPRTCLTCCGSRLGRTCGITSWPMPPLPNVPGMTWEERQVELARIREQLGFRPSTAQELEEDALWRDKRS